MIGENAQGWMDEDFLESPKSPRRSDNSVSSNKKLLYSLGIFTIFVVLLLIVAVVVEAQKLKDGERESASSASTVYPTGKGLPATLPNGLSDEQHSAEIRNVFVSEVRNDTIHAYMKEFSRLPHLAGSERNLHLAEVTAKYWQDFGFDEVRVEYIPVLLEDLIYRSVNRSNNNGVATYRCLLSEPNILNQSDYDDALRTTNGYSGAGKVSAPVVWVNYGRLEDYQAVNRSVSLSGKIAVARYGRIFRGNKAALAEKFGAVGVIIVMDPLDVGDLKGAVLPNGPYATNRTVQRGSVYIGEGDPLTPTWPSEVNGPTLSLSKGDVFNSDLMVGTPLPRIPVQPMGYADAMQILNGIGGQPFPDSSWSSTGLSAALNGKIGPSSSYTVQMEVRRDLKVKNIANAIGTIYGDVEKDRIVAVGGHRDSWTYGAEDPISGHSTQLELSRVLGWLHREKKWVPRRTIQVYSWDGEEWALLGSTEFVEKQIELLRQRGVAYINLDVACTGGTTLSTDGSPSLMSLLKTATGEVILPSGASLSSIWNEKMNAPGSGSDHMGFIQLAGIPVLDLSMGGTAPYSAVYHSNYDSLYWVEHFADPQFLFHQTMVKFVGIIALRLADVNIVPLSMLDYATHVATWVQQYSSKAAYNTFADFSFMTAQTTLFVQVATEFQNNVTAFNASVIQPASTPSATTAAQSIGKALFKLRSYNDQLIGLERVFLGYGEKETGSQYYKHVIFTPSAVNAYGATVMPLMGDALSAKGATRESATFAIGRVAQFIGRAARYLNTSTA